LDGYYNGTFLVTSVKNLNYLLCNVGHGQMRLPGLPLTAGQVCILVGSTNRVGMFDNQNGFFFEFESSKHLSLREAATTQISGNIAINAGADANRNKHKIFITS
jgi:hypothetical protein